MIGDWVLLFDNTPVKVDCIGNVEVYLSEANGQDWRVTYEHIKPIPLTPDFLEKNFGEARNGGYFEGDNFYEIFIIEVNDGTWIIKHDNIEFSSIPRQQVMACFVHELQHALRLCGIDKEIVI